MSFQSILVVSDNEAITKSFTEILEANPELGADRQFSFACSAVNTSLAHKNVGAFTFEPLDMKEWQGLAEKYDLIISIHCKQLFPAELVSKARCINVHPGYNPHNRGWYPQVFSILNGEPLGATIHEIDNELDHGKIIDREEVEVRLSDTSLTAYTRVQEVETKLLNRNIQNILDNTYTTFEPETEGNINLRKDFNNLREIDLSETATYKEVIDRLRALSHPPFHNAYIIDPNSGKKIWITVSLEEEE